MLVGYARTSTTDQIAGIEAQERDLKAAGIENSAALIEASELDYTILRPGWFTRGPEGALRITQKGEQFQGHDVALDSLSALIARIVTTPDL
jgi:hypothetical protein